MTTSETPRDQAGPVIEHKPIGEAGPPPTRLCPGCGYAIPLSNADAEVIRVDGECTLCQQYGHKTAKGLRESWKGQSTEVGNVSGLSGSQRLSANQAAVQRLEVGVGEPDPETQAFADRVDAEVLKLGEPKVDVIPVGTLANPIAVALAGPPEGDRATASSAKAGTWGAQTESRIAALVAARDDLDEDILNAREAAGMPPEPDGEAQQITEAVRDVARSVVDELIEAVAIAMPVPIATLRHGDIVLCEVDPEAFGSMSAHACRQIIKQNLIEAFPNQRVVIAPTGSSLRFLREDDGGTTGEPEAEGNKVEGGPCVACKTTASSNWLETGDGRPLCDDCAQAASDDAPPD